MNLTGLRLAVLVLSTNNWSVVKEETATILAAIDAMTPGTLQYVDIGYGRGSQPWLSE
jgi:hypothetical protein